MPYYDFLCQDCGLTTEKFLKKHQESIDCPNCKSKAFLHLEDIAFCYQGSSEIQGAPQPQATGFTMFDTDHDRVIGEQAKQHWETINKRSEYKHSIAKDLGVARMRELSRNPDGTYRKMTDEELIKSIKSEQLMYKVVDEAKKAAKK